MKTKLLRRLGLVLSLNLICFKFPCQVFAQEVFERQTNFSDNSILSQNNSRAIFEVDLRNYKFNFQENLLDLVSQQYQQETLNPTPQTVNTQAGFGGPNTVENELREDQNTRKKRSLLTGVKQTFEPCFD